VVAVPRSLEEIIDVSEDLADAFEAYEPRSENEGKASALVKLRMAAAERVRAEREILSAVAAARRESVTWSAIGSLLGTSGEAARQRYSRLITEVDSIAEYNPRSGDNVSVFVRLTGKPSDVEAGSRFATDAFEGHGSGRQFWIGRPGGLVVTVHRRWDEDPPVEGPKYELCSNESGWFTFFLRSRTGDVVARSEEYETKAEALTALWSFVDTTKTVDLVDPA